jgi:hypothetical protein
MCPMVESTPASCNAHNLYDHEGYEHHVGGEWRKEVVREEDERELFASVADAVSKGNVVRQNMGEKLTRCCTSNMRQ